MARVTYGMHGLHRPNVLLYRIKHGVGGVTLQMKPPSHSASWSPWVAL